MPKISAKSHRFDHQFSHRCTALAPRSRDTSRPRSSTEPTPPPLPHTPPLGRRWPGPARPAPSSAPGECRVPGSPSRPLPPRAPAAGGARVRRTARSGCPRAGQRGGCHGNGRPAQAAPAGPGWDRSGNRSGSLVTLRGWVPRLRTVTFDRFIAEMHTDSESKRKVC